MLRPSFSALLLLTALVAAQNSSTHLDLWDELNIWNPQIPVLWTTQYIDLSEECSVKMQQYTDDLNGYKKWALKMMDASGRPSSKLMYGNELWLGSRVQCDEVAREVLLGNLTSLRATFRVVHFGANLSHPFDMELQHVSLGVCLPSECGDPPSVRRILEEMVASRRGSRLTDFSVFAVKMLPGEYSLLSDPLFLIMMVACSLLLMLIIAGTILDVLTLKEMAVIKMIPQNRMRLLLEAMFAFSVRRNVRRFFSQRGADQEGSLSAVHGLRVISFSWVMTCHTCLCVVHFSDNKSFQPTVERDFLFQMLTSGTFSVDTFFFLSGLLISYVFLRIDIESKKKSILKIANGPSDIKKFISICVYRFVRLTPPYAFVIGVVIVSMRHSVGNSVFEAPNRDLHVNCAQHWWRNLLYINTFFPGHQMCMGWSWYLSIDTQLYVVATALLVIFARRPRVACLLGAALLLGSWAVSAAISVQHALQLRIDEPFALYDFLYDKPWTRIGPYLVGVATGWILATTACKIRMNKVVLVSGWTLSLLGMFWLVHALHGGGLGTAGSAVYVALSHSLWAVAVAWTLIACTTGNGGYVTRFLGSRLLVPLSRATYCAYLVHSAVIQGVLLHMDAPLTMSRDLVAMLYVGFSMSSYCVGVFVSLAFEAPFISLLGLARRTAAQSPPRKLGQTTADSKA